MSLSANYGLAVLVSLCKALSGVLRFPFHPVQAAFVPLSCAWAMYQGLDLGPATTRHFQAWIAAHVQLHL
jgi:hypothetical protein